MDVSDDFKTLLNIKEGQCQQLLSVFERLDEKGKTSCVEFADKLIKTAQNVINEERDSSEKLKDNAIETAISEYKQSYLDLRNALIDDFFEKIIIKFVNYIETEEYSTSLLCGIKKDAELLNEPINVYLCPRDMVYSKQLEENENITVLEGYDDYIGGYKIISNKITIDNSYKEILKKAKESFISSTPELQ